MISQAPKFDLTDVNPGDPLSLPELPMPRDSHLLPPASRALLRAARAGCRYIQPAERPADDEDKDIRDGEDGAELPAYDRTFSTAKWTALPRHMEPPEVEFLAKRRPGLPSLYGVATGSALDGSQPNPMRKTKFKKVDPATGNILVYEALVPEGHKVEGEISEDAELLPENNDAPVIEESPAPGTFVEGVGVVDHEGVVVAEPEASMVAVVTKKRFPPPPKRKKGFGKGRRKKVMFAPGEGAPPSSAPETGENAAPTEVSAQDANAAATGMDGVSADGATLQDEEDEEEGDDSDEEESGVDFKSPNPSAVADPEAANKQQIPTPSAEPSIKPEPTPLPEDISSNQERPPSNPPQEPLPSAELPRESQEQLPTVTSPPAPPPPQNDQAEIPHPDNSQPQPQDQEQDQEQISQPLPPKKSKSPPAPAPDIPHREDDKPEPKQENDKKEDTRPQDTPHVDDPAPIPQQSEAPPEPEPSKEPSPQPAQPRVSPRPQDTEQNPIPQKTVQPAEPAEEKPIEAPKKDEHTEEGEVDLLGSLAASLETPKHSKEDTSQSQNDTNDKQEEKGEAKDVEMTG